MVTLVVTKIMLKPFPCMVATRSFRISFAADVPSFVLYCFVLLRIDLFCPVVIERPLLCFSSLSACSLSFSVRLLLECLIQMLFAFILVCAVHEFFLGGFCVCVGSMCWSSGMCRRWTL